MIVLFSVYFFAYPHPSVSSAAVDLGISSIWKILQKYNMVVFRFNRQQASHSDGTDRNMRRSQFFGR